MLYDYDSKKRIRLCGNDQLIVDYLESLIKITQEEV